LNLLEAFQFAWQNLTQRRVRSWLTLIGIFAGIAAVVALMSLGQGLRNAVNEQFNTLGTDKFTVTGAGGGFGPPGTGSIGVIDKDDERLISRVNGVKLAAGRYIEPAVLSYRDDTEAVFVASLPNNPEKADLALSLYNYNTEFGREIRFNDRNKLYLGSSIAQQEDGSVIQVGQKVSLNDQRFTVVGIAERKGNPFFDGAILISEPDAIDLFNLTEEYDLIGVQIQPGENLQEVVARVERTMRRDRDQSLGEEDFEISTPDQFLDSLNSILMTVQILLVGIAAISLFVGGIGIANTMYTAVLERNREIGIMKAIGATDNEVLRIFLIESGLLGLAGGVLGVLIGAGIAKGVEFVAAQAFGSNILQASIDPMVVVGVLLFAFILGAVCGTLPARQAARLRPVEALRK
jgi:putative ABC transport system permease protein